MPFRCLSLHIIEEEQLIWTLLLLAMAIAEIMALDNHHQQLNLMTILPKELKV